MKKLINNYIDFIKKDINDETFMKVIYFVFSLFFSTIGLCAGTYGMDNLILGIALGIVGVPFGFSFRYLLNNFALGINRLFCFIEHEKRQDSEEKVGVAEETKKVMFQLYGKEEQKEELPMFSVEVQDAEKRYNGVQTFETEEEYLDYLDLCMSLVDEGATLKRERR